MNIVIKNIIALVIAGIAPAVLPGLVFVGVTGQFISFLLPLVISFAHVFFLGIPAFFLGLYLRKIRWWSTIIASFIVGALPIAILTWPLRYPELQTTSRRAEGESIVYTMVDGMPTATGWSDYITLFTIAGMFGVVGGIAFWFVYWIWIQDDNKPAD